MIAKILKKKLKKLKEIFPGSEGIEKELIPLDKEEAKIKKSKD